MKTLNFIFQRTISINSLAMVELVLVLKVFVTTALSIFIFLTSYQYARYHSTYNICGSSSDRVVLGTNHNISEALRVAQHHLVPDIHMLMTRDLMNYKRQELFNVLYPEWSLLLQQKGNNKCDRMVNPHASSKKKFSCLAVVYIAANASYNLVRHEEEIVKIEQEETDGSLEEKSATKLKSNTSGFFDNVANDRGRKFLKEKLGGLVTGLDDLEKYVLDTLSEYGLKPGDDVVLMVSNAGEMDIFANFMCSLERHQLSEKIRQKIVFFAASNDILPILANFGVIGLHHEGTFARANRHANFEYLDPTFIQMVSSSSRMYLVQSNELIV